MSNFEKLFGNSRINMSGGTMHINGKVYTNIRGTVTFKDGKAYVNGQPIEDYSKSPEKVINITINGNIDKIKVEQCETIQVTGNVRQVKTISGNVSVGGNVDGDVKSTSGDINCKDVEGDVSTTSGDIHCGYVNGDVETTSGTINHIRK